MTRTGVVVYALGGGAGHRARATIYAARELRGTPTTILHAASAPAVGDAPSWVTSIPVPPTATADAIRALTLSLLDDGSRDLVVDTFAAGLAHELDDVVLLRARRTTLIRRHLKDDSYEDDAALAARFDAIDFPYDEGDSEWDDAIPRSPSRDARPTQTVRHVGLLVRRLTIAPGPPSDLVVIGDASRLGPGMRGRLPKNTTFVAGRFASLPPGARYLATSAGYHTTHELAALGVRFGTMPIDKRYDDQFRRAARLGSAILDARDLDRLLAEAA